MAYMQKFQGTKVRAVIAKDGTYYRINPPSPLDPKWTVTWDHKGETEYRQFDERLDAQLFMQERRNM